MSVQIHQIRELYEIADLPFSLEKEALKELKHVLLLMIKGAANNRLEIRGNTYGRNDILRLLEEVPDASENDLYQILSAYPSVRCILSPHSIDAPISVKDDAIFLHANWEPLQEYFDEDLFMPLLESAYKNVSRMEISKLYAQSTFIRLFPEYLAERFFQGVGNALVGRLKNLNPPDSLEFMYNETYYRLIRKWSNLDNQFISNQYQALLRYTTFLSYAQGVQFFEFQTQSTTGYLKLKMEHDFYAFREKRKTESWENQEPTWVHSGPDSYPRVLTGQELASHKMKRFAWRYIALPMIILFVAIYIFASIYKLTTTVSKAPEEPSPPEAIEHIETQPNSDIPSVQMIDTSDIFYQQLKKIKADKQRREAIQKLLEERAIDR